MNKEVWDVVTFLCCGFCGGLRLAATHSTRSTGPRRSSLVQHYESDDIYSVGPCFCSLVMQEIATYLAFLRQSRS